MPEWLRAIIGFLRGRGDLRADYEELNRENAQIRGAYRELMADRNKIALEIRQELQEQIETLRDEIGGLKAALERERQDHAECRRRLAKNEDEISQLKGQVFVLMQKERTREQADGGS